MGEDSPEDDSFIDVTPGRDSSDEAASNADVTSDRDATAEGAVDAGTDPDDDAPSAPLEDLAREVRSRRANRTDGATDDDGTTGPGEDPFEPVDVGQVDDDAVWESLDGEATDDPAGQVGLGARVDETAGPDEHLVPKTEFCQRCPHFADPPETACTHSGTTIVEVVADDRFRVRNCPVAAEREASPDDRRGE
jgi:hypothetical protein